METTLGGDRLGSGSKQKVEMHNYHMSSFNQEQDWKSTMAPGILYPFLKLVGTNHGTFDIDLDHFIRTLPTNAPLFGSFKFQADIFCVPIRLYQGILHNNPVDIGLKMNQVYLPKIKLATYDKKTMPRVEGSNEYNRQISNSSLLKYLGLSGIATGNIGNANIMVERKFNAVPILAYYDIFKNYYSNKQEENAYVIAPGQIRNNEKGEAVQQTTSSTWGDQENWIDQDYVIARITVIEANDGIINLRYKYKNIDDPLNKIELRFNFFNEENEQDGTTGYILNNLITGSLAQLIEKTDEYIQISIDSQGFRDILLESTSGEAIGASIFIDAIDNNDYIYSTADIVLKPFKLKNIDKMRQMLLSKNELGDEFVIDQTNVNFMPYLTLIDGDSTSGINYNAFKQNGLVVKTYQSDLFNNWLNTDTVDLISQMTTMDTTNGFTMDDLNFMEKAYNVLNRIALTGGTYEDWQEAIYGEGAIRKAETPMYVGGMSAEIMFEEVIATTENKVDGNIQALGAIGGKGTTVNKHGGNNIHVKCEEPCYIIGICSITPRIAYSQGNDWDLTELDTLNDLHKPGFDGIGFQDLMIEQMAWWNTVASLVPGTGTPEIKITRYSAGKQIAWQNYMTAIDKVFGDFADENANFMVLDRNYEMGETETSYYSNEVKDLTTYIDPSKYNYAFAYAGLDAQNFWVQIHSKVIARRKMAAQQIPNL